MKVTYAITDVIAERQRQISVEGWTLEHDDKHTLNELAEAAACYAMSAAGRNPMLEHYCDLWPWDETWWKPRNPRRDLVRAAALIIAEIERLDRAAFNAQEQ